jgi:hypothetical protein
MSQKWTRESIALEIVSMFESGEAINYSSMTGTPLLSAAIRHFRTWRAAVEFAGIDYDSIRSNQNWNRERIIARIQEMHAQGIDLSWRRVSTSTDPQLAAAATKKCYFGSWREAIEAAGLDYDSIRRYREWNDDRVVRMVREFHASGADLNAKNVVQDDVRLITAARRRFDSWPEALTVAGLDYRQIVQRAPFKRSGSLRHPHVAK